MEPGVPDCDHFTGSGFQTHRKDERVARQALREVREAVAGYRQQTIQGELDAARQILEAAGIDCRIENNAPLLSPEIDNVLGWVVREGVTNVIRHSRAQHGLIRVSSTDQHVRVEIINDGYPHESNKVSQAGSGLFGLAERVGKQDGHLEAGPESIAGHPGFRLLVDLPLKESISAEV